MSKSRKQKNRTRNRKTAPKQDTLVQDLVPVFTYGSLKRGFHNHGALEDQVYVGTAITETAEYDLFDLGMFPAMSEGGCFVAGEVYLIDRKTLALLDHIEGANRGFYKRVVIATELEDGRKVNCYAYMLGRARLVAAEIPEFARNVVGNIKDWDHPPAWVFEDQE